MLSIIVGAESLAAESEKDIEWQQARNINVGVGSPLLTCSSHAIHQELAPVPQRTSYLVKQSNALPCASLLYSQVYLIS